MSPGNDARSPHPIRALIIDDSEADALLLVRRLKRDGYDVDWQRFEDVDSITRALREQSWDAILCDYNLPTFSAPEALQLIRELGVDLPFLVVSGTVGEERAVELMQAGAHDIILKQNPSRLTPAIEREIAQAALREQHRSTLRSLQENEDRFRHLAESTRVIPGIFDIEAQQWTYVGPQVTDILGYSAAQWAMSDFWVDHVHADDQDRMREQHRIRQTQDSDTGLEYRMVTSDGRTIWIRDSFRVVTYSDGQRIAYVLAFDITETKLRDQQLAQAQKMEAVGQLTGGIAHDFNNLLAIILGNAELLCEGAGDSETAELVNEVMVAADRGADLVRRLLAFSRAQPLNAQSIDLNIRLPDIVALLRRTLGERIDIVTNTSSDLWQALVDPAMVDDALVNLAINARDAMPTGGTLTIETANVTLDEHYAARHIDVLAGDYVMLAVSDTGTGMSKEVVAQAFEPFFTTKEPGRGTGLGLSQVYGGMKQSGGHISVYSEVGHGTTIKLYLPRALEPVSELQPISEDLMTGDETILVVEDNPDVRRLALRQLKELGYSTIEASDAEAALQVINAGAKIDLLFSDVIMPGDMTGYELAQAALQRLPELKILFSSGYTELAGRNGNGGSALGSLLSKPYRKYELAKAVRIALDGKN